MSPGAPPVARTGTLPRLRSRLTVVAGLLSGAALAVAAIIAAVVLLPEPRPDDPTASASPSPTAGAAASPSMASPASSGGSPQPSVVASIGGALFHIGEAAPPLRVQQVGGGEIDLAKLAGQPGWVNFMQTTCPPCVDEFAVMSGFAARYAETGLVRVAVDVRDAEGLVAAFAQSLNTKFPIGLHEDATTQA